MVHQTNFESPLPYHLAYNLINIQVIHLNLNLNLDKMATWFLVVEANTQIKIKKCYQYNLLQESLQKMKIWHFKTNSYTKYDEFDSTLFLQKCEEII